MTWRTLKPHEARIYQLWRYPKVNPTSFNLIQRPPLLSSPHFLFTIKSDSNSSIGDSQRLRLRLQLWLRILLLFLGRSCLISFLASKFIHIMSTLTLYSWSSRSILAWLSFPMRSTSLCILTWLSLLWYSPSRSISFRFASLTFLEAWTLFLLSLCMFSGVIVAITFASSRPVFASSRPSQGYTCVWGSCWEGEAGWRSEDMFAPCLEGAMVMWDLDLRTWRSGLNGRYLITASWLSLKMNRVIFQCRAENFFIFRLLF